MKLFSLKTMAFVAAAGASLQASAGTYTFSYVSDDAPRSQVGMQIADHYDVGMFIPGDGLSDFNAQLGDFSVVVPIDDNITNFRMWVSTELNSPNPGRYFAGNVCNYDADPEPFDDNPNYGTIYCELSDLYKIPAGGIYVGYSFDVIGTSTVAAKYPLVISDCDRTGILFSRLASNYPTFEAMDGIALFCSATLEGDFVDCGAGVSCAKIYAKRGEGSILKCEIVNHGTTPITSIDYAYAIGDLQSAGTAEVAVDGILGSKSELEVPVEAIAESGAYNGTLTVTKVNGIDNQSPNSSASIRVRVLDRIPTHRTVVEEFSGTWCGNCPRGFAGMEILKDKCEDFVGISYHGRDIMQMKSGLPYEPTGYPMCYFDRDEVDRDPYFGLSAWTSNAIPGSIVDEYNANNEIFAPADIDVSAVWNEDATSLLITSEVNFAEVPEDGFNLRVAYVVLEDGLTGDTADWHQLNYLSGERSLYNDPYLGDFVRAARTITDMVYDDVAVYASNAKGVANSLPKYNDLTEDEVYTHTFEAPLSEFLNQRNKQLYQNPSNFRVVAMLVKQDGSVAGSICNGAVAKVPDPASVGTVFGDAEVVSVTYYDLTGRRVANPEKGIYVMKMKMSDGKDKTVKIVK